MTNYNERLDEIFEPLIDSPSLTLTTTYWNEAKQSITSLIKELVVEREYSIEVYFDDGKDKVKMEKATVKVMPPRNIFSIPIDSYRSVKVVVQELTKGEEQL